MEIHLTLYPERSGRFSVHHGNSRYRSLKGLPGPDGRCRLGGGISTQALVNVWHLVQLRSYFYSSERLSLKPANMILLARCKMSRVSLAQMFVVSKVGRPFIPRLKAGAF